MGDALLGEIPFVGILAGYLFHPSYSVTTPEGAEVLRATKRPAMFEGKYEIQKLADVTLPAEGLSVLSLLMMLLLERRRG